AELALVLVDRLPARIRDEVGAPPTQQVLELAAFTLEHAGRGVLEHALARLGGVLLVRADHAARPALDPTRRAYAGLAGDATLLVRDHAAPLVERHPGQRDAAIPDATEHEPTWDHVDLPGRNRLDLSVIAHD